MSYIGSPAAPTIATVSDDTITTAKLADDAVTSAKITDGAVTPSDLSTGHPNWDSSGNVSIGTSSPSGKFTIVDNAGGAGVATTVSLTNGVDANCYLSLTGSSATDKRIVIGPSTSTAIAFQTNATERLRILSSGGITFNGDTASANALDDYEEGTWTPDLQFNGTSQSSYGSRTGGYVKIGRVVTATSRISGTTSATGVIKVFGLPYAPDSPDGTDAIQTCAIWSTTLAVPGTGYAIGRIDQDGNSYVQPMFIINNGEQGVTWTSGNAFNLSFTITYLSV